MGTNYYLVKGEHYPESDPAHPLSGILKPGTGGPLKIHIGKSSGGWCFSLHVYPDHGIHTLADWKNFAKKMISEGWRAEDEYYFAHTPDQLWDIVERVGWKRPADQKFRRHEILDGYCVGNGEGLYDYVIGEFS